MHSANISWVNAPQLLHIVNKDLKKMQNSLILYMQFKAWLIVVNYVMSEINLDYKNV